MEDAIELESPNKSLHRKVIDIALTGEVRDDFEDRYKGHP